jgi:triacylglycerol lipase
MPWTSEFTRDSKPASDLPLWRESFCALEMLLLHAAPIYYGLAGKKGDQSAVIVIPGFLGADAYLVELFAWLHRMNYKPYFSGIGLNAECPNLLIRRSLNGVIERARRETCKRVHLIGHSLGGMIAISAAAQRPDDVASVITLGSPFRGKIVHPNVFRAAEFVRGWIKARHPESVLPECYTGRCACDFVDCLSRELPSPVLMTAIYTRTDGIVDWRYCVTGDPELDFEAPGTHVGLAFNPSVYNIISDRLALAVRRERERKPADAEPQNAFPIAGRSCNNTQSPVAY